MLYFRGNVFDVAKRNNILGSVIHIFWIYEQDVVVVVSQVEVIMMRPIDTFHTQAV